MTENFFDQKVGDLTLRRSELLAQAGVVHAFTTRHGGFSQGPYSGLNLDLRRDVPPGSTMKNHLLLGRALGYAPQSLVRTHQVHRDGVRVAERGDRGLKAKPDYDCDALITDAKGVPLIAFSADCILILLHDPVRGAAGVIHSGWRGTALNIAGKTVQAMQAHFGCFPGNLLAAVGPGIGPCCFETNADVPRAMEELGEFTRGLVTKQDNGKWAVDLKGIIVRALLRAGLQEKHICADSECSRCMPRKYWSHRRSGTERGEQAAVIML